MSYLIQANLKAPKCQRIHYGMLGVECSQRMNRRREGSAKPFTDITSLKMGQDLVSLFKGESTIQIVGKVRKHLTTVHPGNVPFNSHGVLPEGGR